MLTFFTHTIVTQSVDAGVVKTGFNPNTSRSNFELNHLVANGQVTQAHQLFDQMPHTNTYSLNTLISGYVKSGNLDRARDLFDGISVRTAVTWTILIGGYSQHNQPVEAFKLYAEMCRWGTLPDYVTFATLLSSCDETLVTKTLTQVHSHIIKLGFNLTLMVCNSLADAYCKTGTLDLANQLFMEMTIRDFVTFNAMITTYSNNGLNTVVCACMGLNDVVLGQQFRSLVVKTNFVWNVFVSNAILDFYSKHDSKDDAKRLFDEMMLLDCVSYNVIIA
ncbi:hypothetical protein R6Q59_035079 [Mikania micrantha]